MWMNEFGSMEKERKFRFLGTFHPSPTQEVQDLTIEPRESISR